MAIATRTDTRLPLLGRDVERSDARLKVQGAATYAVEHQREGMLFAIPVSTTVAAGRIIAIDTARARNASGVITVITHANVPPQGALAPADADMFTKLFGPKPVLTRDDVIFSGQYVALVIADTFEAACAAAALVSVDVDGTTPALDFDAALANAYTPKEINGGGVPDTARGDAESALRDAAFTLDQTYDTPYEHANAMEPHGAIAEWRGEQLTVWDMSQAPSITAASLAATLMIKPENVRIESRYVGGGFGSKYSLRPHTVLAAIGAKVCGQPVCVALTRAQTFTDYGHRTQTRQRVRLGSDAGGRLSAFSHESWLQTSFDDEFVEQTGAFGRVMYAAPNRLSSHRVAMMNTPTPSWMRAPGETPGSFAVESAMDELAHALALDPVELRLRNEPERDPENDMPWSSRSLTTCLREGAQRFGWSRRQAEPGRVRDGRWQVGFGVAASSYPTMNLPTSARATLTAQGTLRVEVAGADIGTGTHTISQQITADALGLDLDRVDVRIGASDLPMSLGAAGSSQTSSIGSAIIGAIDALRTELGSLAASDQGSPLHNVAPQDITFADARIAYRYDGTRSEPLSDLIERHRPDGLAVSFDNKGITAPTHSSHAFGARFAEVGVDIDTCEVRVRRMLGAFGVGRVINPRTAISQLVGGTVMGLGQALMEETLLDSRWGQWVNHDLAEYHVPVNADVQNVEVFWVDEEDPHVNPLGAKGIGEIAIVGVAASIANAVFNATGIRVRDLPITVDKLLRA